jgi:hypothetical protein
MNGSVMVSNLKINGCVGKALKIFVIAAWGTALSWMSFQDKMNFLLISILALVSLLLSLSWANFTYTKPKLNKALLAVIVTSSIVVLYKYSDGGSGLSVGLIFVFGILILREALCFKEKEMRGEKPEGTEHGSTQGHR